ncbi:MAG: helix-turn-helix domain-containing protein [Hamadaea sp.]|uniref:helix-turn-helix domain-containing protein n=1 Tax=Hamadaea sp. TaxID=2024425 RepID=UPI001822DCCA|nr:helix-turn-helix domain-containing protein [Hamadaea sp.]NUR71650.1 helix-turn-helix domain-containing protein [Hamadaea sp.]NUT20214.1 helix-turn-helix domain-containing protein [Hamadaea sp.]
MRINTAADLGHYVRERRHQLRKTRHELAEEAHVSVRWLANLEAGKPGAEVGLIIRTLHALELGITVQPVVLPPDEIDLGDLLDSLKDRS